MNKRWTEEKFMSERRNVIAKAEYLANESKTLNQLREMPKYKICANLLEEVEKSGNILVQSSDSGDFCEINLCGKENLFAEDEIKKIISELEIPVQGIPSDFCIRLQSEILCAAGATSLAGGFFSSLIHRSGMEIEKIFSDWQYCDRLVGMYGEMGFVINRELSVPPASVLVPPSMSNAAVLVEALLAVEQGVKNITVAQRQYGNMIQDIASIKALKEQLGEYIEYFGHKNVSISTAIYQMQRNFPINSTEAISEACYSAIAAAMVPVNKIHIESYFLNEAYDIINVLSGQTIPASKEIESEISIIKMEAKCILRKVLELGKGDLAEGAMAAIRKGIIDLPIEISGHCLGKIRTRKDSQGAVRYLETGLVPLAEELEEYNKRKLMKNTNMKGV